MRSIPIIRKQLLKEILKYYIVTLCVGNWSFYNSFTLHEPQHVGREKNILLILCKICAQ